MKARPAVLLGVLTVALLLPAALAAQGQFLANGPLPTLPVPADNPQTDAKIRLGAQLYFDPRLSADNTISCSTCHSPQTGWAHHAATDTGIRGQVGGRNSGTILDAAWMRVQFWDGRAASLEEQAVGPIHNPIEMGETLEHVVLKLNAIPGYRAQFQTVFGTDANEAGIAKAIASFERTVVTGPSPYDRWYAGERTAMSPAAVRGEHLFNGKGHCTPCHSGPAFSDQGYHNLGVGMDRPNPDLGREVVSKDPRDRGRFKTPGLRNCALTAPYLHNGTEKTLRDVIDLYDRGGVPNANLDPLMVPLQLTEGEKDDLVAFLEALTGTLPNITPPALPADAPAQEGGAR
ncbi:MAG: cytochrome-c peroxidase [Candidatus Krumholzibacteriia bacterium]